MDVKKEAIELHKKHKGKIEVVSKIALNTLEDLSLVYTPGMTVMEGKAVLFKELGDVDAFPICLESQETEDIIFAIKQIAPSFGGINLEDIATPKCFEIEKGLKEELDIPVFHDDQHGTRYVELYMPEHGKVEKFTIAPDYIEHNGSASINLATHLEGFDIKTNFNI